MTAIARAALASSTGALWIVLLMSCAGRDQASSATTLRDSAGVRIVESSGDLWATPARWRVSPEPAVRIGAVEGAKAYLFNRVHGVVGLSDGRVVVANGGDGTLRWYDPRGTFLFQRGGEGGGPGEFGHLGEITLIEGDTVVAVDWSGRMFTLFGPDGGLGPSIPIAGLTAPPSKVYRLSDGSWIIGVSGGMSTAQLPGPPKPGRYRLDSPVLRLSKDGSRIDTLGVFPSGEADIRPYGSTFAFGPAAFGHSLTYGVRNDDVFVGTADRLQVDVYAVDGRLVRSIRGPDISVELTGEIADAYRELQHQRIAKLPPEQRAEAERMSVAVTLPKTVPAYSSLLFDDVGNLWLGEYRFDGKPPERYLVFDPDGGFLTCVTVPAGLRIMAIAGDRVWGRATDSLDVEYVEASSIER